MKKFVLLSYSITNMGGGQIYAHNKIKFMKKKGYNSTVVYVSAKGEILIDSLKIYKNNYIPLMSINPIILSQSKINKILNEFSKIVGFLDEDTIIETNSPNLSAWGEIIAKHYNCVNFVYIFSESVDKTFGNFFDYKKHRNELAGIKEETYKMIFGKYPLDDGYDYYLPLISTNVVEDYDNDILNKIEYSDFNISTIGRLDKDYVPTLINEIIKFANNHLNINITYVMVGGAEKKNVFKDIKNKFKSVNNIKVYLTDSIYPIPLNFFKKIDVFISAAGSARISANNEKPTISIDVNDFYSIGILNYDTNNAVFRKEEKKIDIAEKLEFLYKNDFYKKIEFNINKEKMKRDSNIVFQKHLDRYNQIIKNEKEYFDFKNEKISFKRKLKKIFISIFGVNFYLKIRKYI